jgi:recombination protein RecA
LAVETGLVKKSGSFYSYGEQRIGQGRENAREYLKAHPDLTDQLEAEIRALVTPATRLNGGAEAAPAAGQTSFLTDEA